MSICPGEKYGKLTVVDLVTDGNANKRKWLCKCECGGVKITSEDNLNGAIECLDKMDTIIPAEGVTDECSEN